MLPVALCRAAALSAAQNRREGTTAWQHSHRSLEDSRQNSYDTALLRVRLSEFHKRIRRQRDVSVHSEPQVLIVPKESRFKLSLGLKNYDMESLDLFQFKFTGGTCGTT